MPSNKLSASIGIERLVAGKMTIEELTNLITSNLMAKPSRKYIDGLVEEGKIIVDDTEYKFNDKIRTRLLEANLISAKASVGGGKREWRNDKERKLGELCQKANAAIANFIKTDPLLVEVTNLKFVGEDGKEFKIIPSHYMKNINPALDIMAKS